MTSSSSCFSDFERCPGDSPFCLGMTSFNCCGTQDLDWSENDKDFECPSPKRKKLSLSKGKKVLSPSSRFNTTVTEKQVNVLSKGCVPKNTARSTIWAVRVFKEWIDQRNKHSKELYPSDILEKPYDCDLVCNCLQRFVSEARRADGTEYPPKTLYQMLCGMLRHSKECQPDPPNFLDRKDVRFKKLHSTCDVVLRSLHESGIGTKKHQHQLLQRKMKINYGSQVY